MRDRINFRAVNLLLLIFGMLALLACRWRQQPSEVSPYKTIKFEEDTVSLIRNPAMGWGLYDDADDEVANASGYWKLQDEAARKYASFFYIRWRWSEMEPEEGRYAWIYDENFKQLIQGAKERGLKLAFRIYVNGQDNIKAATPAYVRAAGAQGYETSNAAGGKSFTPYADDSVFQDKFSKFIKAFAKQFDDPSTVDFVDGNGMGWWGEGHNIKTTKQGSAVKVFDWVTKLYATNFKRILLVTNLNSQEGFAAEKQIAFSHRSYIPRRDGLGSFWYSDKEKEMAATLFPQHPFIGESCYWGSSDNDRRPFKTDPIYKKFADPSWKDSYILTYEDAMKSHSNTLDLREPLETKRWIDIAPELVKGFIINGGYRFSPVQISVPAKLSPGKTLEIKHSWKNSGVGMCPNNNQRWNYKYKVAFALISKKTNHVHQLFIDDSAEISEWLKGTNYDYQLKANLDKNIPLGSYYIGVAIVDKTLKNIPAINLAVKNHRKENGWLIISDVKVIR